MLYCKVGFVSQKLDLFVESYAIEFKINDK
jgi:hypothetical protein